MKKTHLASAIIFTVVALAHLMRLITGAEITIEGWFVPLWISIFGVLVPATLAYKLWRD